MRRVLLAIVLVMACRRDRAADTPRGTRPGNGSDRARPGQSVRISDDELAAYTRWQRDSMDLFLRHRAEIDAVAINDPSLPFEDINAVMPRIQALTARHAPAMQALLDRVTLKARKAELAAEGTGGI